MPGLGFLLGGAVTATLDPRAVYAVAGGGILVVLGGSAIAVRRAAKTRVDSLAATV